MQGRNIQTLASGGRSSSSPINTHLNGDSGLVNKSEEPSVIHNSEVDSGICSNAVGGDKPQAQAQQAKGKKKKGWKGWALVVEDDAGNVIEVKDGEDLLVNQKPSLRFNGGELQFGLKPSARQTHSFICL